MRKSFITFLFITIKLSNFFSLFLTNDYYLAHTIFLVRLAGSQGKAFCQKVLMIEICAK